jgi:hypothetical protein
MLRRSCSVGRCGGSGCVVVLVDESVAGGVSSDRSAGPIRDNFVIVGCALTERPVGPVRVVMLDVLLEESINVSARSGAASSATSPASSSAARGNTAHCLTGHRSVPLPVIRGYMVMSNDADPPAQ